MQLKNYKKKCFAYKRKKGGKDQESIQSSTTFDPEYYMEK